MGAAIETAGADRRAGSQPIAGGYMANVEVHLYALVWNELPILPFFLEHYRPFVSQFHLWDDGSDDGSFEYLSKQPDVVLNRFDSAGESFVERARSFYCDGWKASRGKADFVIVVNIDELVYHPDPLEALSKARQEGVTAIETRGWDMIGDEVPVAGPLIQAIPRGVHSKAMSKLAIFDPDAIAEIRYGPGRHKADPRGRVVFPPRPLFDLLHYKHLSADYVVDRYRQLGSRMREGDVRAGYGVQYSAMESILRAKHDRLQAAAVPVLPAALKEAGLLQEPRPGLSIMKLKRIANDKGALREIWRDDDPFGVRAAQAYITATHPKVVKAWYQHRTQTDQITTISGAGRLVLWDVRDKAEPALMAVDIAASAPALITIPPGIWHGFQATGDTPLVMLHLNDQPFDHVLTDEIRLPADDPAIPYRWPELA